MLKKIFRCVGFILFICYLSPWKGYTYVIKDIVGRTISIDKKIDRVILADGRQILTVAILEGKDVFKRIVGIGSGFRLYDGDSYKKYLETFPILKNIPEIGDAYKNNMSLEFIASLDPKVIIFNLEFFEKAKKSNLIRNLRNLKIASVFIDFRMDPIKNTIKSMKILGKILNQEKRAKEFIDFYKTNLSLVKDKIKKIELKQKPLVYIESAPGYEKNPKEYKTYGNVNMGQFIHMAGGINLASKLDAFQKSFSIKIQPEFVLVNNPDRIILTGSNWDNSSPNGNWIPFGYYTKTIDIQDKLRRIIQLRAGWNILKAVKNEHIYGIYHQFYNSPYHFIVILQFAKWFYPELFKDISPRKVYDLFHRKFLPIQLTGSFWGKIYNK